MVIPAAFDVAQDFNEELAYGEVEAEGFKGFIDRMGQRVISLCGQQKANYFHEGLAAAQGGGNKMGLHQ